MWIAIGGAACITLYFNSKIQDPFNSPKFWLLIVIASWLFGHLLINRKELFSKQNKILLFALGSFIIGLLISLFFTDPLYTGLFGETQRRNGFLNYLSLIIVVLVVYIKFNISFIYRFSFITMFLGITLSIYGLLQISGIDFVKWNNPYNAVISTVGNPNFAAAIMAIMAVLSLGFVLDKNIHSFMRFLHGITFLLSISAIILSDARQGLISFAIGVGVILIYQTFLKSKRLGIFSLSGFILIGFISILGMLQIGPLTKILYKESVSLRGYYWRAGLRMFQDHIFTGVGLDRYGAFFKQYRDSDYSLRYGFDITSSNAHSVPIQMFATGGLLLGISYLVFVALVLRSAYKGMRNSTGQNQLFLVTLFSAWLAYQAQSLISIDNIGISVWGWLISGLILALGSKPFTEMKNSSKNSRQNQVQLAQPMISGTFSILTIILVVALYRGESSMYLTRGSFNPNDANARNTLLQNASNTLELRLSEPAYKIASANYLAAAGFQEKAIEVLSKQIENDPRNLDALNAYAEINERLGNVSLALSARESINKYDPFNTRNLLQLGREYKFLQRFNDMDQIRTQIASFDQKSAEYKMSVTELVR